MKLAMIYPFIKQDLDIIESELNKTIQAEHPILRDASTHLLQAGGKRIRPVFVLLAGKFGKYDINTIKYVAVALELIHMASLVHDDVIDDAELRRGKPTIKSKWDNRIAMYTGDYIFARSIEYLTQLEIPKAHRVLSEAIVELSLGEIEQIKDKFNAKQNLRTYLRRIKRKTALLIAASCQLGAIAGGAEEHVEKALFRYGYYVGMSYQIIDDVLDIISTEKELGKPAGSDLKQGHVTLPVLFAMTNPDFKRQLTDIFKDGDEMIAQSDVDQLLSFIKGSEAIDASFKVSEMYLQKAYKELDSLPNGKAKHAFMNIAKYIGKRNS